MSAYERMCTAYIMKVITYAIVILSLFEMYSFEYQIHPSTGRNGSPSYPYRRTHVPKGNNHSLLQNKHRASKKWKRKIQSLKMRIIGGKPVKMADYPFVVRLHRRLPAYEIVEWCGATIVNLKWVLTAAHCIKDKITKNDIRNKKVFIRSNGELWDGSDRYHQIITTLYHKYYFSSDTLTLYDIGAIKVKEPFNNYNEKAIPFARTNHDYRDNTVGIVLGWGVTEDGDSSNNLMYAKVNIISLSTCQTKWSIDQVRDYMVCTFTRGKGTCGGDSGGPLIHNGKLIGITSYGATADCINSGMPDVFTKVAAFKGWIDSKISRRYRSSRKQTKNKKSRNYTDHLL